MPWIHSAFTVSLQLTTVEMFLNECRTFIVAGEYPAKLLDLWDDFSDKKKSENIRPGTFDASQRVTRY